MRKLSGNLMTVTGLGNVLLVKLPHDEAPPKIGDVIDLNGVPRTVRDVEMSRGVGSNPKHIGVVLFANL